MHSQPQNNYLRGVSMILMSAFCFACMNICIRLSGNLPSIQKSFFRNLVAALFAGIIILKNYGRPQPVSLYIPKEARTALILRCVFGTAGILCNFYAVDHLLVADASILNTAHSGCLHFLRFLRLPVYCKAGIPQCRAASRIDRGMRRSWSGDCLYHGA